MSDERLSDVTRLVSLLARWSPTPAASDWSPDDMAAEDTEVEAWAGPCTDRLRRLSGPIVYGRVCGVRRRTASRCSRALPLAEDDGDEEEAVGAIAMVTAEGDVEKGGGKQQGEMRGQRRTGGRPVGETKEEGGGGGKTRRTLEVLTRHQTEEAEARFHFQGLKNHC